MLDVRTPAEFELATIPGAVNIPLDELRERLGELDPKRKIVAFCQVGKRGYFAERILRGRGFDVANLSGGFTAWRYFNAKFSQPNDGEFGKFVGNGADSEKSGKTEKTGDSDGSADLAPTVELDLRALSCPGPIVELKRTFDGLPPGAVVRLAAAPTFEIDMNGWARLNGVRVVRSTKTADRLDATLQKGDETAAKTPEKTVANGSERRSAAIVLFSDDLDKATAAAIMACGAAASGLETSVFFTFWGLSALRKNPAPTVKKSLTARMFGAMLPLGAKKLKLSKMNFGGLGKTMMKGAMKAQNVPELSELLRQAKELGVRFVACETAMNVMEISREELIDVDEVAGVGRFVELAENAGPTLFV